MISLLPPKIKLDLDRDIPIVYNAAERLLAQNQKI